jgi:nucleoid DNA-binding protein
MSERLTTRSLAELLAEQTSLDKYSAEQFIDIFSSHIINGIEKKGFVKLNGLGIFKITVVKERESIHIKTSERFVIPEHHKISFLPDKNLKEHINRPFAIFKPLEAELLKRENGSISKVVNKEQTKLISIPLKEKNNVNTGNQENDLSNYEIKDYFDFDEENESEDDEILDDPEKIETEQETGIDEISESEQEPIHNQDNETEKDSIINNETEKVQLSITDIIPEQEQDPIQNQDTENDKESKPNEVIEQDKNADSESETNEDMDSEIISDKEEMDSLIDEIVAESANIKINSEPDTDNNQPDEEISPENDDIDIINPEKEKIVKEKKKKHIPLWIWFLIIPFFITVGVGLGTFAFHRYNLTAEVQKIAKTQTFANENLNKITEPLTIGAVNMTNPDDDAAYGNIITKTNDDQNFGVAVDSVNKDTSKKNAKPEINWFAPAKDNEVKKNDDPENNTQSEAVDTNKTKESSKSSSSKESTTQKTQGTTVNSTTKKMPSRVKLESGGSLTQIALEYYGDKIFWVYIYDYNKDKISNFQSIPVGTEIRLPLPHIYGINAKNKNSVQKAKNKQAELLRWNKWDDYK